MVVYPYLVNHHFALYKDLINPYPPALTWALAQFTKAFGYSPQAFKLLTWSLILVIDVLIFKIAKELKIKKLFSYFPLAFFVILSVPMGANGLWFELVQTIPILLAVLFLLKYFQGNKNSYLLLSISLISIAFFIKQQTLLILIPVVYFVIAKNKGNLKKFIASNWYLPLPLLLTLLLEVAIFALMGDLKDFLYWNINFPFISSSFPGYVLFPTLKQILPVLAILLLGSLSLFQKNRRVKIIFVIGATATLFAYPRFDYFHLVPQLALLCITLPFTLQLVTRKNTFFKIAVLLPALVLIVFCAKSYKYQLTNNQTRFFEKSLISKSRVLKQYINSKETVYMQNSDDQLLVLLDVLPIKPWADEFPWYLEKTILQNKIVWALETQKPKYIIFQKYISGDIYGLGSYKPEEIVQYIDQNYHIKDYISDDLIIKERN